MPCFITSGGAAHLGRSSFYSYKNAVSPICSNPPSKVQRPCQRRPISNVIVPPDLTDSIFPQLLLADISEVNKGPLFATAFVFFLTFWGSISFVKGSTKERLTQASFTLQLPAPDIAKKTARYLMGRSFVADPSKDKRKGVMTFTGQVRASSSVAAILVAVAASGLWATTYILNFVLPQSFQSDYWGLLSLASFAVVPWYRNKANRTEYVKVMVEEDDESPTPLSTLYVKGHRDEIEQLEKHFAWKRNEPVYEDEKKDVAATQDTVSNSN